MSPTGQFRLALMGYDRRQVDGFREEMEAAVDQLRERVTQLAEELDQHRQAKPVTADQAFSNVGRETQQILQSAQEAGARLLREARAQAESEIATARRERSEILRDGYRARDEISQQLGRLDDARARLVGQLQRAASEVERVCTGLEADASRTAHAAPRASTGTDEALPRATGATLRVITSGEPAAPRSRHADAAEPATPRPRRADAAAARPRGSDVVADKQDQLAPIRLALIEHLSAGLRTTRDQLHERVRQLSDDDTEVVVDESVFGAVMEAGTIQLRHAFEAGVRAAAASRRSPTPVVRGDDLGGRLADVLDEVIAAPVRALLSTGMAADDPPWVLAERLDGVLSDASEAMVTRRAETELSRAYERGKLATWVAGDVVARRWIIDPRGHRADESCRRDAAVDSVKIPEPFPSGEHTPPRQDGCTCTTIAVDQENTT